LETIFKVADFGPPEVGENVAVIVQLAFFAKVMGRVEGQVSVVQLNMLGFVPSSEMFLTTRATPPVLVMVNGWGNDGFPIIIFPKSCSPGDREISWAIPSPTAIPTINITMDMVNSVFFICALPPWLFMGCGCSSAL
jgi:hypothetical protein